MQKSRDYFYFERKAEGKRILPWRPSRPLRENFTEWVSRKGRNDRKEDLLDAELGSHFHTRCITLPSNGSRGEYILVEFVYDIAVVSVLKVDFLNLYLAINDP